MKKPKTNWWLIFHSWDGLPSPITKPKDTYITLRNKSCSNLRVTGAKAVISLT